MKHEGTYSVSLLSLNLTFRVLFLIITVVLTQICMTLNVVIYLSERRDKATVAPPTQGTWRSNDYVNAVRLVDYGFFYGVGRGAVYIHIGWSTHMRDHARHHIPSSQSQHNIPNITFPTLVGYLRRDKNKIK